MDGGEAKTLLGWDGKETRPCISQVSTSFQTVGSLLVCQVNAPQNAMLGRECRVFMTAPHDWVLPGAEELLAQSGVQKMLA